MERPHWLPIDESIETDRYSQGAQVQTHSYLFTYYLHDAYSIGHGILRRSLGQLFRCSGQWFGKSTAWMYADDHGSESGLEPLAERRRQHRLVLLFKAAILRDCPSYFHDLLPHLRHDLSVRGSRHVNTFDSYPLSRSSKYLTSFSPRTTGERNDLPLQCRTATTVSQFKRLIRQSPSSPPMLLELPRYSSILYSRLNYGCSSLNSDLFNSNLVPTPLCSCRTGIEDLFHFLYNCHFYDVIRENLVFELTEL